MDNFKIISEILEQYRNGMFVEDIANNVGIGISSMRVFITVLGALNIISDLDKAKRKEIIKSKKKINTRKITKHRHISDKKLDFDTLKYEYIQCGLSMKEISTKHGCGAMLVSQYLDEYGLKNKFEYPLNLIKGISPDFEFGDNKDDQIKGLEFCLNEFINEREKTVLINRYKNRKTLRELGREFNVYAERIRQIQAKALRKLRNPTKFNYILYGYNGYSKILEEIENKKQEERQNPLNFKFEDVIFSTRVHNALRRHGIEALGDIESKEQLMRIRNLGRKSVDEIVYKLREYGIIID